MSLYFPFLVVSNKVIGAKIGLKRPENGVPGAKMPMKCPLQCGSPQQNAVFQPAALFGAYIPKNVPLKFMSEGENPTKNRRKGISCLKYWLLARRLPLLRSVMRKSAIK